MTEICWHEDCNALYSGKLPKDWVRSIIDTQGEESYTVYYCPNHVVANPFLIGHKGDNSLSTPMVMMNSEEFSERLKAPEALDFKEIFYGSTLFQIWVVACRPYVEKIVGGMVETPDGVDLVRQVDGTFSLDKEDADVLARELNERGPGVWSVYSALVMIQK